MHAVDFGSVDELIALRDQTVHDERHFFCNMSRSGICIERPKLRRWNTYGEVLALRKFVEQAPPRTLICYQH